MCDGGAFGLNERRWPNFSSRKKREKHNFIFFSGERWSRHTFRFYLGHRTMISLLKMCVAIFSLNCTSWCKKNSARVGRKSSSCSSNVHCERDKEELDNCFIRTSDDDAICFGSTPSFDSHMRVQVPPEKKIITFTDFCSTDCRKVRWTFSADLFCVYAIGWRGWWWFENFFLFLLVLGKKKNFRLRNDAEIF